MKALFFRAAYKSNWIKIGPKFLDLYASIYGNQYTFCYYLFYQKISPNVTLGSFIALNCEVSCASRCIDWESSRLCDVSRASRLSMTKNGPRCDICWAAWPTCSSLLLAIGQVSGSEHWKKRSKFPWLRFKKIHKIFASEVFKSWDHEGKWYF